MARLAVPVAVAASALAAAPTAAPAGDRTTHEVAGMVELVNSVRRSRGLPALRASPRLRRSALLRVGAILRCGEFSHSPCGQAFAAPFAAVGYLRGRASVAENLAWGGSRLGARDQVVAAWLRSPSHRSNLLARGWRDVGVAAVRVPSLFGNADVTVWVAQFGRR